MNKLNVVRSAAFLMTLLVNADMVENQIPNDHPAFRHRAKCERCGQTGPTVPIAPVVFRGRAVVGLEAPHGLPNASLWPDVRTVRVKPAIPAWDEFGLDSSMPTVGGVFTR